MLLDPVHEGAHDRVMVRCAPGSRVPVSDEERARIVGRSSAVFALSMCVVAIGVVVGFGIAFAACADTASHLFDGLGGSFSSPGDVKPVPIPATACPYLRLVSASATDAGTPWHDALQEHGDWNLLKLRLTAPLASLDNALGTAIPQVPDVVAQDLRETRRDVQIGRAELLAASSVSDYLGRSNVIDGYQSLAHAGALVGTACGFALAPPLPF
jgi:hypothetical protein